MPEEERTNKPAKAAKAEVDKKPIVVDYEGNTYTVARDAQGSIEFLEALEDNKGFAMVRALLGRQQWAQFKLRHKSLEEFNAFADEYGKVSGQGNS